MVRVRLLDRKHEVALTTTLILAPADAPEAIVWGDRVFLLATPEIAGTRTYQETRSWTIPTTKAAP